MLLFVKKKLNKKKGIIFILILHQFVLSIVDGTKGILISYTKYLDLEFYNQTIFSHLYDWQLWVLPFVWMTAKGSSFVWVTVIDSSICMIDSYWQFHLYDWQLWAVPFKWLTVMKSSICMIARYGQFHLKRRDEQWFVKLLLTNIEYILFSTQYSHTVSTIQTT